VSELNVVVADSVSGNVTLRLVNVPWDQALDIILQAKGLDKRRRGNVIWIAQTAEIAAREQALEDARIALEDRAPLVSEYIAINYGSAKEIAELMTSDALRSMTGGQAGGANQQAQQNSGFLSNRGSVTFDERTNTLLINDTAEKITEIRELIRLLDRPVDQVLIESRIVIADESFGRELGAKFGLSGAYEDGDGNVISTGGSTSATDNMLNEALANRRAGRNSGLPVGVPNQPGGGILVPSLDQRLNVNLPVVSPAGSFALAVLGQDYLLDLELSALSQEGKGEVISSPRVITSNQREAVIRQGDEVGYVTISPDQGGGIPIPNVQFKDVLLELKVTPTITQDQRVFLTMNVKKDEIAGFVDTSIGQVPQITKREINTAVLVENGQTVVLGGVYEFRSRKDLSKVPFLGDLPAVGLLFRNTSSSSDKAELLIFVTPKILDQGNR
jgi:type IV pilus assembly protein PilQ